MGTRKHIPAYQRFCGLLRVWRSEAGLSQRALAQCLQKPPSYVHKVEVADRRIDPLEFIAWCEHCGQDPAASIRAVRKAIESRSTSRSRA